MNAPTKPRTLTRTTVEWVANPFEIFLGVHTDMCVRRMDGTRVSVKGENLHKADPRRVEIFAQTGNWIFSTLLADEFCPVCDYPTDLAPYHTMTCKHNHDKH